jgi:hypothetical protein
VAEVAEPQLTGVERRRAARELLETGFVHVDGSRERKAQAWSRARAVCQEATRADAIGAGLPALEVVGQFTVPPPGAQRRDFQALHLDFGLPIGSSATTDVVRFTALRIDRNHARTSAMTRIVPLGALLAQRRWVAPERLLERLRDYVPGAAEGILGRLIEAADGTPSLPAPGGDVLCGLEFGTLADERRHFLERGLDLDSVERLVGLKPGGLLIFDNLTTAHGRVGIRRPLELEQLCLGYRRLDAAHQTVLITRVLALFFGPTPAAGWAR